MFNNEKTFYLSFKKLDNYFRDPDLKIQNLYAISAQQFTKDLDSIINFSRKKLGLYGKIDEVSVVINSNATENGIPHHLTTSAQKRKKTKLYKILYNLFRHEKHPLTTIKIKSWKFSNFKGTGKFQIGELYAIKPVCVTYNSTQQDYKYNKQIISEFCIEEANGNIKNLIIIDDIKNGKTRRKKYIDGQKINYQHYNLEIRNHRLNRGLMKTFLFQKINKYKTLEYNQYSSFWHNKTNSNFALAQPITNESCQVKETIFSTQEVTKKIPEEYIKTPSFKAPAQNQKKAVDINNVYKLQDEYDNGALTDDNTKVQETFGMETNSIQTADDYNDLKRGNNSI